MLAQEIRFPLFLCLRVHLLGSSSNELHRQGAMRTKILAKVGHLSSSTLHIYLFACVCLIQEIQKPFVCFFPWTRSQRALLLSMKSLYYPQKKLLIQKLTTILGSYLPQIFPNLSIFEFGSLLSSIVFGFYLFTCYVLN